MASERWTVLNAAALRRWPLPTVPDDADKEARGRVLVIAGSREIPGAALLAAVAAMRAGAGKLVLATGASVAPRLAMAVPEARVLALPETPAGGFAMDGVSKLETVAHAAAAVLVGPGLMDEASTVAFVRQLLPLVVHAPLVLDALAMNVLKESGPLAQPVLITPHAGEMAHLTGAGKDQVEDRPAEVCVEAARRWQVTVALKGASTHIAGPQDGRWRHDGGQAGLATSGSGDVLAGIIVGLAAQRVPLAQACAWGVVLHALAGRQLAGHTGPLGFLARELPGQVPALLRQLRPRARVRR